MGSSRFPALRLAGVVALILGVYASGPRAQEVTTLRGKPSSAMILQALAPNSSAAQANAPAAPVVRRRGLSLNNDSAANEGSNDTGAAAAVAVSAPAAPAQASVPQTVQVQQPAPVQAQPQQQARALDLDIKFQFNSDQLTDDGKDVLDQLAAALKSDQLASVRAVTLEGHADARGSELYNQTLSFKRAQSARNYLTSRHGIPSTRLKAIGKGSAEPADPNHPEDEINRRVRVIVGA